MKTLNRQQVERVNGGVGKVGAVIGAGIGVASHLATNRGDATVGSTLRAAGIGAATGAVGNLGAAAAGSRVGSAVVRSNQFAVNGSLQMSNNFATGQ